MAKLAEVKTKPNAASVEQFIDSLPTEQKQKDAYTLLALMKKLTKEKPKMWGASIIGFGYQVVTSKTSGRTVEWMKVGFSPRKANITLYLTTSIQQYTDLLKDLGKHKTDMGCLYINKLEDVNLKVLEKLIRDAYDKAGTE